MLNSFSAPKTPLISYIPLCHSMPNQAKERREKTRIKTRNFLPEHIYKYAINLTMAYYSHTDVKERATALGGLPSLVDNVDAKAKSGKAPKE